MSWDEAALTWDDDPAVRAYSLAAFRSLQDTLRDRDRTLSGGRVLDFGCGTGLLTQAIAQVAEHVVAHDISPAMIAVLAGKRIDNVQPLCAELSSALGGEVLPRSGFDLITCSSVCGFLEDYPSTAAQLVSLLAPGGLWVQWDWERDPTSDEPMGLSRGEIAAALQAGGLVEVTVDVGFEVPFEGVVMAPLRGVGRAP